MTSKLEKSLFQKYPKIFRQKDLKATVTCMCWGIECPDTWYYILDCLCWTIQTYIDNPPKKFNKTTESWEVQSQIPQVEFTQVKEKFGTLRVYTDSCDPVVDNLIMMAEAMTQSICCNCGSSLNVQSTRGWVEYLCEDCRLKRGLDTL